MGAEEAIVKFALQKVTDLLIMEGKLLVGVREQVKEMEIELKRMQCFLKDVNAKREEGDERVRNWAAEIRDVSYDAEDAIEKFMVELGLRKRDMIRNMIVRHKVGNEIVGIKNRISSINTSLQTYGVKFESQEEGRLSVSRQPARPRQAYAHIVEQDIIGLEQDTSEVVEFLLKQDPNCRVIALNGMGGMGKTTLAKQVYRHDHVRRHFKCFAWAYISQQYQKRAVLEGILVDLIAPSDEEREKIKKMREEELFEKLYEVQVQVKCLVILDDLWRTTDWDHLSPAFPNSGTPCASKVIVTSRNRELASHVDPRYYIHDLKPLSEQRSWELFETKALQGRSHADLSEDMLAIGKEMVRHCGGLPLAIIVLGGLLATKASINEWKFVRNDIHKWKEQKGRGILDVLALSYKDLPYHLKACFLHLAHFPEDYVFGAERVARMWVAEGLVPRNAVDEWQGRSAVDTARSYLNALIGRCMIQVVQFSRWSERIKSCQLHDIMRDFCILKADEDKFLKHVHITHESAGGFSSVPSPSTTKFRRLTIYLDPHDQHNRGNSIKKTKIEPNLRSAVLFSSEVMDYEACRKQIKLLATGLNLLRVLDLEGAQDVVCLPKTIGSLIHLRYLSLRGCWGITKLPKSVGKLRCLETLDLRVRNGLIIPNILYKLVRLRHLYFPRISLSYSRRKLRLDELIHLETLVNFSTFHMDINCLLRMTNLHKIKILVNCRGDLAIICSVPSISNDNNNLPLRHSSFKIYKFKFSEEERVLLSRLLGCPHLHKLLLDSPLRKFPEHHHQFASSQLTMLDLVDTRLEEDPMPLLEKLPNLTHLALCHESYMGKEMVCSSSPILSTPPEVGASSSNRGIGTADTGFPILKYLKLSGLYNLEEWRVDKGSMPNLLHLEINFCEKLKQLPEGLRFLRNLKKLKIEYRQGVLISRIEEGGADFYKIQHVPFIDKKNGQYSDIWLQRLGFMQNPAMPFITKKRWIGLSNKFVEE